MTDQAKLQIKQTRKQVTMKVVNTGDSDAPNVNLIIDTPQGTPYRLTQAETHRAAAKAHELAFAAGTIGEYRGAIRVEVVTATRGRVVFETMSHQDSLVAERIASLLVVKGISDNAHR